MHQSMSQMLRCLVVLKDFDEAFMEPEDLDFGREDFWVHVIALLMRLMTKVTVKLIGDAIGSFVTVDGEEDGLRDTFMCIKVSINLTKPIRSRIVLSLEDVDVEGRVGSLALLWRMDEFVSVKSYSKNHIDVEIMFRVSITMVMREDFTEIFLSSEKEGGDDRSEARMSSFKDTCFACGLRDFGFRGPKFTWWNNKDEGQFFRCGLDRALANGGWCIRFPRAAVFNKALGSSDHLGIYMDFFYQKIVR
ncbi:Uncharacterized protein TCM_010994 [Theobroma cacao]|uniref:Uncharacterized protein n=1 Tax=Theobroma cacao TaxID=3641 RepID=A0A061E7W5_THECC|nr:Uncharacterized protein TCM_010994 [Theobroma cacao]